MAVMVLNKELAEDILEGRNGFDNPNRREEVWDGVTYIMPDPDNEHYDLVAFFVWVFRSVFDPANGDRCGASTNVTDRLRNWTENYRVPDATIFLAKSAARDRHTNWLGGPDLAVEIVSPNDGSRGKLDFYGKIGTGEVLVLDRDPWKLELYRNLDGEMKLVGTVKPSDAKKLRSSTVPFEFYLIRSRPRPKVKIIHTETGHEWVG